MDAEKERGAFASSLDRHVEEEDAILREYRELSEKLGNGPVGFLIDLILTEEEQHHFLLRSMAKRIRQSPVGEVPEEGPPEAKQEEVLEQTRRLWEHERETITAFRALHSQVTMKDVTFYQALLEVIISDSEKHQRLLSAVEKMIEHK